MVDATTVVGRDVLMNDMGDHDPPFQSSAWSQILAGLEPVVANLSCIPPIVLVSARPHCETRSR